MGKISKKELKLIQRQYAAIDRWIARTVNGPGDSEYDCYAYDLPLAKFAKNKADRLKVKK